VVVSGLATGRPVEQEHLSSVRRGVGQAPVLIGSGFDAAQMKAVMPVASGAIVATHLKAAGRVEREKVQELVRARDAMWQILDAEGASR
jgi:predicted TIM-barrel enzyme